MHSGKDVWAGLGTSARRLADAIDEDLAQCAQFGPKSELKAAITAIRDMPDVDMPPVSACDVAPLSDQKNALLARLICRGYCLQS